MSPSYGTFIGGFIVFLAVTLLALLDVRRGFLFEMYPVRTLFYVFTPIHGLMLTSGLVGMIACYRGATSRESRLSDTSGYKEALIVVIFALLVIDLFAYRGVPAARSLASGRINADWLQAFGVIGWRRPFAQATSYLLNVWHATMLGILISGLTLSILPMYLKPLYGREEASLARCSGRCSRFRSPSAPAARQSWRPHSRDEARPRTSCSRSSSAHPC